MLYLVSLQQLSKCPFRLVDEINQGMDPNNEKMIFDRVSHQATMPDTPQYFLITPKLLPNLRFDPSITVLCVFNGPWQLSQSEFKLENLLKS
jgi:chromosome segregation ATPase